MKWERLKTSKFKTFGGNQNAAAIFIINAYIVRARRVRDEEAKSLDM